MESQHQDSFLRCPFPGLAWPGLSSLRFYLPLVNGEVRTRQPAFSHGTGKDLWRNLLSSIELRTGMNVGAGAPLLRCPDRDEEEEEENPSPNQ
jgi:hypothetical protein